MSKKLSDVLAANGVDPTLTDIVTVVTESCSEISGLVRRGALSEVLGALESENVQGEVQKKLDVISNDIMLERCAMAHGVVAMASEEMDTIHPVRDAGSKGGYLLLFDPLDGSSNIDVNVSIGTIFSILPVPKTATGRAATEADFMQPGRNQVCAGYVVYGPQTTLVLTFGAGVMAFTLDPESEAWIQTAESISVPKDTREFAINASNMRHWAPAVRGYVETCLAGETGPRGKNFNMRWIASMVADVHRIMMRGGVFLYPWDTREPDRAGKLRLMYEANPMSLIIEQAGGGAFDGFGNILDAVPTGLHQRISVMLGSANEVAHIASLHR